MRVTIVVVTPDESLARLVGQKKISFLDAAVVERAMDSGISLSSVALLTTSANDAKEYFLRGADGHDGVIVVLDSRLESFVSELSPWLFVLLLGNTARNPNFQNLLRSAFNGGLKSFLTFFLKFKDAQYQKILLLPIQNFVAPEFRSLVSLFCGGVSIRGFTESFEVALRCMRDRQRPKTRSPYQDTYHVDDQRRFYQIGKEHHARAESARPPHFQSCLMAAKFRFGARFEDWKHYNVSEDGSDISGVFQPCHGSAIILPPRSHVNVFPNDYF